VAVPISIKFKLRLDAARIRLTQFCGYCFHTQTLQHIKHQAHGYTSPLLFKGTYESGFRRPGGRDLRIGRRLLVPSREWLELKVA
jgi:hypothetical protein